MNEITPGTYQHYKGRYYQVLMSAVDDETREPLVIYVPLYDVDGQQTPTVRTLANFTEVVRASSAGGRAVRRFERVPRSPTSI